MLSYEVGATKFISDQSERHADERTRILGEICDDLSNSTTANVLPDSVVGKKKFQLRKPTRIISAKGVAMCQRQTLPVHPTYLDRDCDGPRLQGVPRTGTHRVANKLNLKRPSPVQADMGRVSLAESIQISKSDQSFNFEFSQKVVSLESRLSI